jgi:prealbumin domain-containing protein
MRATSRIIAVLSAATLLGSLLVGTAYAAKPVTGNPAGDLDQCANGGVNAAPIQCAGSAWQNGNLNGNQAHYSEGHSVPYRLRFTGLTVGTVYNATIEWDTTQSGKHALDYLTSFDRTETTANACSGVTGSFCAGAGTPIAIPGDLNVSGAGVSQVAGSFRLWGGNTTSTSGYTLSAPYTGSSATKITVTFTATVANPVLAWGGHIATRIDWGQNNSAVSINGSPFHMRFLDLNGSGGNQDRSLSNDAVVFPAQITIIKDTSPNAATSFSFTPSAGILEGFPPASPPVAASTFGLVDNGAAGTNTKQLSTTTFGSNLTVIEADPGAAYAVTGACVESGTQDSSFSGRTATIKAQEAEVITCTFTNTLQNGTITLTKVVQSNNGGNAGVNDFGLTIGGQVVSSGGSIVATPGTPYAINETLLPGYEFVSITGTGCPAALGGTVTVGGGGSVSCTITNRDLAPTLALTKTVSNTSGGNNPRSDWTLTATAAAGSGASNISGSADVTATAAKSNVVYTLSESNVLGYTNGTTWICSGTGVHQEANTVTLEEGAAGICNVTNTDQAPTLALTKTVTNSNGGNNPKTDWTLSATAPVGSGFATISGTADVGATVARSNIVYTLSESAVAGYTNGTTWTCTDAATPDRFSQTATTVTLFEGAAVSCSVTNTDQAPTLALDKIVSNPNGGNNPQSAWTLSATPEANSVGATLISGSADVGPSAAKSNVVYTLSESSVPGYTNGTTWTCSDGPGADRFSQTDTTVTLFEGAAVSCSVTNADIAPTLALDKDVSNTNGGNNLQGDWTLSATPEANLVGATLISGSADVGATAAKSNVIYTLSESTVLGYTNGTTWTCTGTGVHQVNNTVSLDEGAVGSCTVTNTDQAPTLALTKVVSNTSGGNDPKSSWILTATPAAGSGYSPISGSADVIATAAKSNVVYTLSESNVTGYTNGTIWTCTDTASPDRFSQTDTTVTLFEGAAVSCSVTNVDDAPTLALTKTVSNLSGGNNDKSDWTLSATAPIGSGFATITGAADVLATPARSNIVYTLSESTVLGYTNGTSWTCTDAASPDRFTQTATTVTLFEGAAVSCTVTNTDVAPTLALDKTIDDDFGGGASEEDFVLTAHPASGSDITNLDGGDVEATAAKANMAYTLSETSLPGYAGRAWTCSDGADPDRFSLVGNVVTLDEGAVVTCSIINDDSPASPTGTSVQHWVLHDTLTISGIRPGGDPSNLATVTFRLYSDDTCATQVGDDEVVGITAGVAATSDGVTVYETGLYYWTAEYSGDAYNNDFTTTCGEEITQIQAKDNHGGGRDDLLLPI